MTHKILIPQDISPEGKDWLTAKGYEIKMGRGTGPEEIAADLEDCDAILARTAKYPARVLEAGNKLKVISRHGVGVDNIDVEAATNLGIWVTYAPESNAATVAEHTIAAILTLARRFFTLDRETRRGNWESRNSILGTDVAGLTLGLVGLGRIGARVAQKAALGLEMKVIGYDPFLPPERYPSVVTPVKSLDEILAQGDFISLHAPATEATRRLIGAREFSLMKKTAYFINAARGELVDEGALIEALQKGLIAGAAIDVYEKEPPEGNNPLFGLNNVLLTPHNASQTRQCMIRMALHAAQGIHEVLSGQEPTWPVNKPARR
jgi:D-3-phosphoglycerate dehydrogenase